MTVDLRLGDVLHWAATYDGSPFHALLSDPPYELGFMGKDWDRSGVAFRPETWAALMAHLLPGAFGMVFASSRGWHRLACAIEDAGMRIQPSIFAWVTGQSFPKATRIPDSRFDGHRYGGQTLKNAVEPIIVFQKPYAGKPVECITATGAGALNIDGGRVAGEVPQTIQGASSHIYGGGNGLCPNGHQISDPHPAGRWPANFILDDAAAARLDQQSGTLTSGKPNGSKRNKPGPFMAHADGVDLTGYGDSGGASRFFFTTVREQLDAADPVRYCAKSSRSERDAGLDGRCIHPTVKPLKLAEYLARLLLPPAEYAPRRILVPFAGVASEMIGAALAGWEDVVGIEREAEYAKIGRARLAHWLRQPALMEVSA